MPLCWQRMYHAYFNAPLPDYLYEKYNPQPLKGSKKDDRQQTTDDSKNEDYIRFENFLAGEDNAFIGRGAPRSNTEAHLRHLKQMNKPVDILRYVKGVDFPGKAFMVSKYNENKEPRAKNQDGKKEEVYSEQFAVNIEEKKNEEVYSL